MPLLPEHAGSWIGTNEFRLMPAEADDADIPGDRDWDDREGGRGHIHGARKRPTPVDDVSRRAGRSRLAPLDAAGEEGPRQAHRVTHANLVISPLADALDRQPMRFPMPSCDRERGK